MDAASCPTTRPLGAETRAPLLGSAAGRGRREDAALSGSGSARPSPPPSPRARGRCAGGPTSTHGADGIFALAEFQGRGGTRVPASGNDDPGGWLVSGVGTQLVGIARPKASRTAGPRRADSTRRVSVGPLFRHRRAGLSLPRPGRGGWQCTHPRISWRGARRENGCSHAAGAGTTTSQLTRHGPPGSLVHHIVRPRCPSRGSPSTGYREGGRRHSATCLDVCATNYAVRSHPYTPGVGLATVLSIAPSYARIKMRITLANRERGEGSAAVIDS